MKLFNKTIDRQLFKQYSLGSDLSKQEVVVKIFNPTGQGNWFILNSDPEDPDYLWAIVDLGYGAEVGSVSRSELENYRGRFGLGFERDLGFTPINAEELYKGLRKGEYYADGGNLSRDRKFVNHSQQYEVDYSKGKNRKGYGYANGGETENKDTWQNILENFGFKKGRSKYGLEMYYKKGYIVSVDKELRNVDFMFEDNIIYKGYSIQGFLNSLENEFGKRNFANGGEVSFIEYKDFEIMYEPIYGKYYANDVEFDSLQEAKDFLDSGETDPSIRDAYKRGLFAEGGNIKENKPYIFFFYNENGDEQTFLTLAEATKEAKKQGEQKVRDNLGGEYFIQYADGGEIEVVYERRADFKKKPIKLLLLNKGKEQKGFTFSGKDQVAVLENYNRNKQEDLEKLWNLKGYESKYADGGDIESFSDNQRMIMNQNVELEHHHEELEDILENEVPVPAWVVAKMATATQSVSDVTHYLDGQKEIKEDELDDDDDDELVEVENIKDTEVVEPVNVSAGTKAELTKKFTNDAWGNLKGFLKGMEGIDLRDDYTFDYKDEQYEVEPIINSDENGVSNAVFSIFNGDGEEVGEVAYSREGGKQKFTANSEFFSWNDAKFEDGGYFDGTIPNVSTYMSTYAKGGEMNFTKDLTNKEFYEEVKSKVGNSIWEQNALNILRNESIKNPNGKINITGDLDRLQKYISNGSSYAKGGEIAKAEVFGLKKNIMGTTDIEMKISGMRKAQDFIVYPIGKDDTDQIIKIQSETRIGKIDLKTGRGLMSQSHSNGAYFVHLQMDKLTPFTISESDLEAIKAHIFKTAGSNVGTRGIVSDNSGASGLFAHGGGLDMKYYVIDVKDGKVVSKGFDTEEEAKVEKFEIFEKTNNFFLSQKKMSKKEVDELSKQQYANGGGIGFIPMDLEEDLRITANWGGTNIKGVIGILNAMIDSGLTDEDLKPKPTKSGTAHQNAIEKRTNEIWAKIEPEYKGDLKGNMPYGTIRRLVEGANSSDEILKRFKPFRKLQKDSFADGGSFEEFDGIAYAKTKGRNSIDWDKEVREYAGSEYDNLTKQEYEEIVSFLQRDLDRSYSYADGGFMNNVYADGGGIEKSNPFVENVKIMKDADLSMNSEDERKILDLSINMALQNGGRYMCPFNKSMFNLTTKQIDYIDALIQNYVTKYGKKPNFGMKVNGKYFPIQLRVYSKFIQGSNRYENKKYLVLYSELDSNYLYGGFMNDVYADGGFLDKHEVDRFKQVMNGKAIAKYIVRLQDSFGNKETYVFGIKIKDQFKGCELVPYESLYGGWSNSGTAFSLDNLQVKRLVPNSFFEIELDEQETEMLINKLVNNNQAGVEKYLNSNFFYLSYNQSFKDVLKGHLARSVSKIVSIEFEIVQKFANGGEISVDDLKTLNAYWDSYYKGVMAGKKDEGYTTIRNEEDLHKYITNKLGSVVKSIELIEKGKSYPYNFSNPYKEDTYSVTLKDGTKFRIVRSYGKPRYEGNVDYKEQIIVEKIQKFANGGNVGNEFNYMLLGRLVSDCDYYLGNGNRYEKHLWAGDVDSQIKKMKELWNGFPEDAKPEWLSMKDILDYEKKMKNQYADGGYNNTSSAEDDAISISLKNKGQKFYVVEYQGKKSWANQEEIEIFKEKVNPKEYKVLGAYFNGKKISSLEKGGTLKKYILKADIKTVTLKRNGKEVTYKGDDVLNGANVLADGGDITSKANYVPKRDVVEVELKDGTTVKPVNGYWVKKGAEPISNEPTPTSSDSKIGTTEIRKDPRGNWRAETKIENFNNYDWKITTIKTSSGNLLTSAQGGKYEQGNGYTTFKFIVFQDPNHTLEVSKPKRLTDKVVSEQHNKGLDKFKKFMETGMFKGGGKISNFDKLSDKVAKQYEGKPVQSQYQEEYGKYYSKEEAQEVGDKVAGKVKAMQANKKENGGRVSMKLANDLAKQIRKEGESWNDAKKRAFAQLKG